MRKFVYVSEILIVRHLGTPNSGFNGCHCMRDPVLYRSMDLTPTLTPTSSAEVSRIPLNSFQFSVVCEKSLTVQLAGGSETTEN